MHVSVRALLALLPIVVTATDEWPQFRGPASSGVASADAAPPVEFSVAGKKRLRWQRELAVGHSSPVVWGDRIFITAAEPSSSKLELICLSARTGAVIWRHAMTAAELEKTHPVSNVATASPAVDADRVYVYFSSHGLMAFNHQGKMQWDRPLAMPKMHHGSGASPILAPGNLLILNRDAMQDGFLLAIDRGSGKDVWRQPYPARPGRVESYSSPAVWGDKLILHRAGLIEAFAIRTGERRWSMDTATSGLSTPIVNGDVLFVSTWNNLGEDDQRPALPDFATLLKSYDQNGDGKLAESEFPFEKVKYTARPELDGVPRSQNFVAFRSADRNKDGILDEAEWTAFQSRVVTMTQDHGMIAIREVDGKPAITWREKTSIPEVPSPLLYMGRLYLVRNGGILTCLDAESGRILYRARAGAPGAYFASPVAAAGRVYIASSEGVVTVLDAGAETREMKVLARNAVEEEIVATPAIAGRSIYVRTARALYAFGME